MKCGYLLPLVSVILMFGCASPPPVDTGVEVDISKALEARSLILTEGRDIISVASPQYLMRGLRFLDESEIRGTERSRELRYVAFQLLKNVYPRLLPVGVAPQHPATGIFPRLFSSVTEGEFPELSTEETSFLTLLVASTVVLFTDNEAELNKGWEGIQKILTMEPDSALPHYLYGYVQEYRANYDEAIEAYQLVIDIDDTTYTAEKGLGRIYLKTGQPVKAHDTFQGLREKFTDWIDLIYLTIESAIQAGRIDKAEELISSSLSSRPDDLNLVLQRARLLEIQGRNEQARRLLLIPEQRGFKKPQYYLVKAKLERKQGEIEKSLQTIEEGLELYPDFLPYQEFYGTLLLETGRHETARSFLQEQLEKQPDNLLNIELLLKETIQGERWPEAAEFADKALSLQESPAILKNAVTIYRELGELQRAERLVNRLVDIASDNASSLLFAAEFFINQADKQVSEEEKDSKENYISKARELLNTAEVFITTPKNRSEMHYLLSLTLTDEDDKLNQLRQALFEDLRNKRALLAIAEVFESIGEYRQAVRYLRQALVLDPGNQEIAANLNRLERMIP